MPYVTRAERVLMSLTNKVANLETRVLTLEGKVTKVHHSRGDRRSVAAQWIKKLLDQKREHKIGSSVFVPNYAEHVRVILDEGRRAGFSPVLLREARSVLGDAVVKVTHADGSKLWIWRLCDEAHTPVKERYVAKPVGALPVTPSADKATALIKKMLANGTRLEYQMIELAKAQGVKISALLSAADDLGVVINYTHGDGKRVKSWSLK